MLVKWCFGMVLLFLHIFMRIVVVAFRGERGWANGGGLVGEVAAYWRMTLKRNSL